jgi:hypothetical protein
LIPSEADFTAWGFLPNWLYVAFSALMYWIGFEASRAPSGRTPFDRPGSVGNALTLNAAAFLPVSVVMYGVQLLAVHGKPWLGSMASSWLSFVGYWLGLVWCLLILLRISHALQMKVWPALAVASSLTVMSLAIQTYWPAQLWYAKDDAQQDKPPAFMQLSQELFESQNKLLQSKLDALAPQRADQRDVFVLTYAPYAPENVFWKESEMVREVMGLRFDAASRGISLLNNPATTATHAWATPRNLERTLQALAAKMDREQDVLMLYLTSHGAKDFKLASSHWPLQTDPLTPQQLAHMLTSAGIKHRIIAVSACYSGGWIEPLKTEHSLIMTAADATHTSYGCGTRSDLTFFGRAVFDEQLRKQTRSLEQAFATAVPIIKKREEDAGKDDGFSNPQIFVGAAIKTVLPELEKSP